MLSIENLEEIEMKEIFDYYDIPLTFIFELDSKLYYANLIDFKEDTNTEVYWVNEVTKEQYEASLVGKTSHYELMTQLEDDDLVYFIKIGIKDGERQVEKLTNKKAIIKYGEMMPGRDSIIVEDIINGE